MKSNAWILELLKKHKWLLLLALGLVGIQSALGVLITGFQKYIIDDIFILGEYDKLVPLLLLFGAAVLGYSLLFTIAPYMSKKNESKIFESLNESLMSALQRLPMSKIQGERTAQYVQLFTSDIKKASTLLGVELFTGFQLLTTIVILSVVIGIMNPLLLVFVFVISAAYVLVGRYYLPKLRVASGEVQENRTNLTVMMEEGISSTREVIAFNRLSWERKQYQQLYERFFSKAMKEERLYNRKVGFTSPLKWGVKLAVFSYGGYLLMQGDITVGMFVVLYQFSDLLIDEINLFSNFLATTSINMAYLDRIKRIHDEPKIKEGTESLSGPIDNVHFENVTFAYSEASNNVLSQLTLDLPMNKKIAFVGPSGGGKSTISQLLIRFFEPTHGAIYVNHQLLDAVKREEWSSRVSIVFQDPYLLPDTIRNNITLGREYVSEEQVRKMCEMARIDTVIEQLSDGYETIIGERGVTLSGGQRQRLAIARALLDNPEILIFDEATSSLDMETERVVQQGIDEYRNGKTTIVIAHRLSTIQNADLIYVLDKGRIASFGTHEELLEKCNVYYELYTAQDKTGLDPVEMFAVNS